MKLKAKEFKDCIKTILQAIDTKEPSMFTETLELITKNKELLLFGLPFLFIHQDFPDFVNRFLCRYMVTHCYQCLEDCLLCRVERCPCSSLFFLIKNAFERLFMLFSYTSLSMG